MRSLILLISVFVLSSSCGQEEGPGFTEREAWQPLYPANQMYGYEGKVIFKEMQSGEIEVTIELKGNKGNEVYYFPAHLHFGAYDTPDAPLAAMLNPVDIRSLKSTTVLSELSDGKKLLFDDLGRFDGHIKIHLAADGPDYRVILTAGNLGRNLGSSEFRMEDITVCSPF